MKDTNRSDERRVDVLALSYFVFQGCRHHALDAGLLAAGLVRTLEAARLADSFEVVVRSSNSMSSTSIFSTKRNSNQSPLSLYLVEAFEGDLVCPPIAR